MPFVKTDELDMHYETGGEGKDVFLLLHGNYASWRWWIPVLKNAPEGYRVYAPDLRGCGDSDRPEEGYTIARHAEDINQLIHALHLPRLHLVGHSLGGCVALEYALQYPNRIKTLTLVAPAPAEGQSVLRSSNYGASFRASAGDLHSALRMAQRLGATRRTLEKALSKMMDQDLIDVDFESLVDDAVRMSNDAAVGHVQTLVDWDVLDALDGLHMPVLIIGGQNDPLISSEALDKAVQKIPKGRLIVWPKMGHTPQLEHPQRFINIIQKFTKRRSMASRLTNSISRFVLSMSNTYRHDYYLMYD